VDEDKCAQCGTPAPPGAKYCESCGAPLLLAAASQPAEVNTPTKTNVLNAALLHHRALNTAKAVAHRFCLRLLRNLRR